MSKNVYINVKHDLDRAGRRMAAAHKHRIQQAEIDAAFDDNDTMIETVIDTQATGLSYSKGPQDEHKVFTPKPITSRRTNDGMTPSHQHALRLREMKDLGFGGRYGVHLAGYTK